MAYAACKLIGEHVLHRAETMSAAVDQQVAVARRRIGAPQLHQAVAVEMALRHRGHPHKGGRHVPQQVELAAALIDADRLRRPGLRQRACRPGRAGERLGTKGSPCRISMESCSISCVMHPFSASGCLCERRTTGVKSITGRKSSPAVRNIDSVTASVSSG